MRESPVKSAHFACVRESRAAVVTRTETTRILHELRAGDPAATNRLIPLVYDELRSLAAHFLSHERPGHTLQPTALVHEAFLRLVESPVVDAMDRAHFLAVAANVMRRVLVDHARARLAAKRGAGQAELTLGSDVAFLPDVDVEILALENALTALAALDERQARVVELRFFGGMTVAEVANLLNLSKRSIENDWELARAWLHRALTK